MIQSKLLFRLLSALVLTFSLSAPSFALHPELQVPDKVEMKHAACQAMTAIARKYAVEGVLSTIEDMNSVCFHAGEICTIYGNHNIHSTK